MDVRYRLTELPKPFVPRQPVADFEGEAQHPLAHPHHGQHFLNQTRAVSAMRRPRLTARASIRHYLEGVGMPARPRMTG